MILNGDQVKISVPSLRIQIGNSVIMLLKRDVDRRHGFIYPRTIFIEDIVGKNIVTSSDSYHFSDILEIVKCKIL